MSVFEHTCPSVHLCSWMYVKYPGSKKPKKRRLLELRGRHLTARDDEDVYLNDGDVVKGVEPNELVLRVRTRQMTLFTASSQEADEWFEGLTYAFAKLENYYEIGGELGRGAFSTVYKAIHRRTGRPCAVKVVDGTEGENMQLSARETSILISCVHDNIIKTYDIFDSRKKVCFVMEYLKGGELYDIIADAKFFSEENARDAIRDVLKGVAYLHSQGIAHRDLKPENLLCMKKEFPLHVKVSDFGLSNFLDSGEEGTMLRTVCGSLSYIAPEMLRADGYGPEVDLWACGVILHVMLSGKLPFVFDGDTHSFLKSLQEGVVFDEQMWEGKSVEGRELVRKLLEVNPKRRLTADSALRHPWFSQTTKLSKQSLVDLNRIRLLKSYRGSDNAVEQGTKRKVNLPPKLNTVALDRCL